MSPREVILAFLAARYPAAFSAEVIATRVNASGLFDNKIAQSCIDNELQTLSKKFNAVECEVDRLSGSAAWTATTEGVRQWHLNGQLHVGA